MRRKTESAAKRAGLAFLSLLFALVCVLLLAAFAVYVHPGVGQPASYALQSTDLASRLDTRLENARAEALSDVVTIRKHYVIPEDATVAPVPDPDNFGTLSIDEAEKLLPVIEQARKSGLLEGQDLIFSPERPFYHDSFIGYYYDETILMILWKEVVNGTTCSCCEVKIADASQMRRKITEDTLGSPVWVYASELARSVNPVVAMNADFYMFRDFGVVVYQRQLWRMDESTYTGYYKKYNCVDTLFVDSAGDFHFTHMLEEFSRAEMQKFIEDNDILFSISFGPVLVENGELKSCEWYPAGEPDTFYSRAAFGQVDHLHYYYMSSNHSPETLSLWTVDDMARAMYERGVRNAYAFDGGQTSEILFRCEPYNYIDFGSERGVSDILYFASALPGTGVGS